MDKASIFFKGYLAIFAYTIQETTTIKKNKLRLILKKSFEQNWSWEPQIDEASFSRSGNCLFGLIIRVIY